MSGGLVGDRADEPIMLSPSLKQVFSLIDGRALDDESVSLSVYEILVWAGVVQVHNTDRVVETASRMTTCRWQDSQSASRLRVAPRSLHSC